MLNLFSVPANDGVARDSTTLLTMRSFNQVSVIHAKSTSLSTANSDTSSIFGTRDMTLANNIFGTKCSHFDWFLLCDALREGSCGSWWLFKVPFPKVLSWIFNVPLYPLCKWASTSLTPVSSWLVLLTCCHAYNFYTSVHLGGWWCSTEMFSRKP